MMLASRMRSVLLVAARHASTHSLGQQVQEPTSGRQDDGALMLEQSAVASRVEGGGVGAREHVTTLSSLHSGHDTPPVLRLTTCDNPTTGYSTYATYIRLPDYVCNRVGVMVRIAICPGWHPPLYEQKRIRPDNTAVLKARLRPTLADAGASGGATARYPWHAHSRDARCATHQHRRHR